MGFTENDIKRFASKYEITDGGCWLWCAGRDKDGYGVFWAQGKPIQAHRFSLITASGESLDSKKAMCLHGCNNRACVNPSHLRWGNNSDNMQDRNSSMLEVLKAHGRWLGSRFGGNGKKLSKQDIENITGAFERGQDGVQIARFYGVSTTLIYRIKKQNYRA